MNVSNGNRYLRANGLRQLAQGLRGDETIHAGMRPYGFHAGNKLPLLCYPLLLCEEIAQRGIEPSFRYAVTLNDWETDGLDHPPGYPVNFTPRGRTFQFQPDPGSCHDSVAEHWEQHAAQELRPISERFPRVTLEMIRASTLAEASGLKSALRAGLTQQRQIKDLLHETLGVPVLDEPLRFAGAVCPVCRSIEGETSYQPEPARVSFQCSSCGSQTANHLGRLDYWLYVHLLGAGKYLSLRPAVWFFGGDFLEYRTVDFLDGMVQQLSGQPPAMAHVFTPILLAQDGQKMSKSLGNTEDVPVDALLEVVRGIDSETVPFPGIL